MKLCKPGLHQLPDDHTGRCPACRRASKRQASAREYDQVRNKRLAAREAAREAAAQKYLQATGGGILGVFGETWMDEALCAEVDPEIFFPPDMDGDNHNGSWPGLEEARQVCNACDVQVECLEYALRLEIEDGMFGGLTHLERKDAKAAVAS